MTPLRIINIFCSRQQHQQQQLLRRRTGVSNARFGLVCYIFQCNKKVLGSRFVRKTNLDVPPWATPTRDSKSTIFRETAFAVRSLSDFSNPIEDVHARIESFIQIQTINLQCKKKTRTFDSLWAQISPIKLTFQHPLSKEWKWKETFRLEKTRRHPMKASKEFEIRVSSGECVSL